MEERGLESVQRPLRILLVTNHRRFKINFRAYPWARELVRRGHEVDVLCHADLERWRTHVEFCEGFRIVHTPDLLIGALRQGWDPCCAWRRYRFLRRENVEYDVIHCLDTRLAVVWPALAYARRKNTPIVSDWIDWWGRGGLIYERRPLWYRLLFGRFETWFEEHYRPKLDGLTTISHALRDRAVGLGCDPKRSLVISGGADLRTFASIPDKKEAKAALGIGEAAPVVCFSGLDVLIDLPLAVKAFEYVQQRRPDTVFLMVGPRQKLVRKLVSRPETMKQIVCLGPVPYEELPQQLAAADVFLMPYAQKTSNVGRWPNKIGDYMCVGRPTVSNPVGEVKGLLEKYDIGLLADENPERMGEAVLQLLDDPEKAVALGEEARRVAEEVLSWERQIKRLEKWYYQIVSGVRPAEVAAPY